MLQASIKDNDFLAFTLAHPQAIDAPFKVNTNSNVNVEVLDTGVICFTPKDYQKDIVLSCAVHGNETAPIEICNELITGLLTGELTLKQRVLFLIGNPPSIHNKTRFVEENMNRLFSGGHAKGDTKNQERVRAKALEGYVRDFFEQNGDKQRIHYDLHTAIKPSKHEKFAIYPYRHKSYSGEQMMFLAACGVDTILYHHEPTTTFSYYSSNEFGADAFTVELGKVMPFGQNDMSKFAKAKAMLTALVTQTEVELPAYDAEQLNLYKVSRSVNKHFEDFTFSFADSTENFTQFNKGEVLATEGGQQVIIEHDIEAIVFPNAKVPVGQRTVLCLIPAPNEDVQ
ncbi:succinylglutamate desuccinylase [Shewanella sp. WXL01]|uniref:succinylglutamate desuccinylase n=1 Tax=Shewanella sp. WXL01 TaxID=2709721 RepID=UPI001438616D|nr:succinylglutamate desuccinylase [Shewanella sp. WXL01]